MLVVHAVLGVNRVLMTARLDRGRGGGGGMRLSSKVTWKERRLFTRARPSSIGDRQDSFQSRSTAIVGRPSKAVHPIPHCQ